MWSAWKVRPPKTGPTWVMPGLSNWPMGARYSPAPPRKPGATQESKPPILQFPCLVARRFPEWRAIGFCCPFWLQPLQLKEFPQPSRLYAANRHFGVLLIVHPELIAGLEPRHDLFDPVDVHQVGPVHAPEHVAVQIGL